MRRGCSLGRLIAVVVSGIVAALFCVIALSARDSPAREIRIVARGMTFYLDGGTEPNPVLRVRRGEYVRLVFRNEDAGMKHDFTVPDWGVETKALSGRGETSISFRVPEAARAGIYACTPHSTSMRGTLALE